MQAHEVDYEIIGDDLQLVEVELDPGETVIAEAGAMTYMEDGIVFESKLGDGTEPRGGFFENCSAPASACWSASRCSSRTFAMPARASSASRSRRPSPARSSRSTWPSSAASCCARKDGFLAAAYGTQLSIAFNQRLGAGFFGGEGFILQRMNGDGMVFVHAGGTVIRKDLNNSRLRVDTGCVVAFTSGIDFDVERAGNLRSMLFGGEGLFLATLQGTGSVWIQSMPFSRLADRVLANAPSAGGARTGEGSILGGLGDLLDGD